MLSPPGTDAASAPLGQYRIALNGRGIDIGGRNDQAERAGVMITRAEFPGWPGGAGATATGQRPWYPVWLGSSYAAEPGGTTRSHGAGGVLPGPALPALARM